MEEDHEHLHRSDSRAFPVPVEKYSLEAVSEPCVLLIAPGIQRKKPVKQCAVSRL